MDSALLAAVATGDRKALSRAITHAEAGEPVGDLAISQSVIGFTGPPGVGKSTLISALIGRFRGDGDTVAVLAVDPSSPFTGGAILGDRIRMQSHVGDDGVFVRSMATRGHLGGLAIAAAGAVQLMGHAGYARLIVETVGVGQSEVEVMNVATHVVLVVGPSWGDDVQADKAGIVEIADLFVINKGDRPGVSDVRRALIEVADARDAEIIVTTATDGKGIDELLSAIERLDDT